ncbi:DNRLRE domain-containing protein [Sphaerimonospora mesophila]|uniref:DNRLRE domain-containing protein n=1 Tax=Sphaerimonospora mesophila TaxID=37483 RepID=UPI00128ED222
MSQRSPSSVRVETFDTTVARRLGGVGLAVRLTRDDGGAEVAPAKVTVDYSSFGNAHPGGFASRLTVLKVPVCMLEAKPSRDCLEQAKAETRALPVVNDVVHGRLTAVMEAAPASANGTAPTGAPASADAFVYVPASSAASTGSDAAGSFAATDLKPSGTWQVGLSGGAFSYSYPVPAVPPPAGSAPTLALEYSSSSVDSLTSYTNNQAPLVGMGWELNAGFIERQFQPCGLWEDRLQGHLCWESPDSDPESSALTLSVGGRSSKIVKDDLSGEYKTVDDFGWKIDYVASGSQSGQPYWQVTTQDGTVYRFGYHRNSSWQVPVLGDNEDEPCHAAFLGSGTSYPTTSAFCDATWRWQLDREVDPRGNVIDYTWARETNFYCRAGGYECGWLPEYALDYDRGGYLTEIGYGHNLNVAGSTPTARITFTVADRGTPPPGIGNWSDDTPTDLLCLSSGSDCDNGTPTFFTSKRLDAITSQSWNAASSDWEDVTRLDLTYRWIETDCPDGTPFCMGTSVLWLDRIRAVGMAGGGPEIAAPPIDFTATLLDNRADYVDYSDDHPRFQLPRMSAVTTGLGGVTEITYGQASPCDDHGMTGWDDSGQDCYGWELYNYTLGESSLYRHGAIYNKWLVMTTMERDLVAGSPDQVTRYEYLGSPGWAKPVPLLDTEPIFRECVGDSSILEEYYPWLPTCYDWAGNWTEFRGYPTVRVIKGTPSGSGDLAAYSVTSTTFYRGLYEDTLADGSARHTTVTDFDGTTHDDLRALTGMTLQEQTLRVTGVSGTTPVPDAFSEEASTRYEYANVVTGSGPIDYDPHRVNQTREVNREKTTSGWRYTETKTAYNADGLPVTVNDYGERGDGADNTCTATTYARNTSGGAWMISYPASQERRAGDDCETGTLLGRTITLYDGATSPSANTPTRGNVTETRAYSTAADYTATKSTFDDYGRPLTATDPLGKTTTTAYSPAVGWPSGGVTVTNPLGHTVTTWSSPYNGLPVGLRDANNNDVNIDYDVLGRTLQLWTPVAPKSGGTPAAKVAYTIPADANGTVTGPAKTTVSRLQSGSGSSAKWVSTHTYIDGLGRARETQTASPTGGRIVQVTTYDARGLTAAASAPVHNTADPGSGLLNPVLTSLPQWSKPIYDGLGRATAQLDMTGSSELRRTTTNYLGADKYEVTPPTGGKTVYYTDAADQVTKIEEWLTSAGNSGQQRATAAGPMPPALPSSTPRGAAGQAGVTPEELTIQTETARTQASAEAKRSDRPVNVAALTSAVSSTVANPDGSFTTTISTQPTRVKRAGKWTSIDVTLVEKNGSLVPKAGPEVEVSMGGDGPFATMADGAGNSIELTWPTSLPRPMVDGNVARYADAAGTGADLVVTVLPGGVRHDVVLRQRPTGQPHFKIGIKTAGWRLEQDARGHLRLTDGAGKLVTPVAEPVMFAASGSSTKDGKDSASGAATGKGRRIGRIVSRLTGDGGNQVLELTPDASFLADPTVRFPVVVDPTITLSPQADTWVGSCCGMENSFYTDSSLLLTAGWVAARAYLKFDTSALAGVQVSDAILRLYKTGVEEDNVFDGSGPKVQRITSDWNQSTLTWAGRPSITTSGQASIPASAVHNGVAEALSWTVTSIVQAWASGTANYGVEVRAANETLDFVNMEFHSAEKTGGAHPPQLVVTYTVASSPSAADLSITPSTGTTVTSVTPTLHATVADPAGGSLRADYEIEHDPAYPAEGTGVIWAGSSAAVASASNAPAAVPGGNLTDGWHIRWRARATNTATSTSSAWSAWQTATVTVTDPVVDQLQTTPSQDESGVQVTSTLTPAFAARVTTPDGATARVEFELEHDPADTAHGTGQIWVTGVDDVASGAQATVTVPSGALGDGWKVRWRARAVGGGSNTSAWSGWQALTVKVPAATVGQRQVTPSQTADGTTVITSLTPQLLATVTDSYGAALRAEFELEHDPADTAHGTGPIWTGAVDDVASGAQAAVTIPSGKLADGWGVRWRVRAVNTTTQVASPWSDWQVATVNTGTIPSNPGVTALQVTPAQAVDGTTVTGSLTPQLLAQVTDPAGGTLRAEFELEHDPAAPAGQGTGQIWTGAADNIPAGTQASVTIPEQTLSEGWLVRWRARAIAGEAASAWSEWQTFRVDQPDPVLGSLQVVPSEVIGGATVASTLMPQLLAQVTDPAGGKVRAEFELEHDPADTEHGTGSIWSDAVDDVDSGTQAAVTVPEGKLSDGWKVRWRARAITGGGTSAWSAWQQLRVTEGSPIPEIANPRVQPASGTTTTPTLTPALLATVTSSQGGQLGAEFELEHAPSAPAGQGTGQIWTTTVTGVASGNDAVAAVPAGKLQDGWKIRWRVRAVNAGFTSEWTTWQQLTVDVPDHYDTAYEYDRKGQLIKQTDANGNVRTFTYDLLGRRTAAHDPDAGDSEQAYDAAGRMLWSTNGKGQKVSHTYDDLGRKTAVWSGEPGAGTKLAEWTYDTLAGGKGQLTSATRYAGGNAYVDAVTGYDSMGRPTGSALTVPSSEGLLAGTYTFATTYNTAGDIATYTMPAAGDLPAETVTSTYTDLGLPHAMTSGFGGGFTYVHSTTYSSTARLNERSYGAGGKMKRTLAWDNSTGWLKSVTTTTKADTLNPVTTQDDHYTYDVSGQITRILDAATAAGTSPGQSECFTYDGLHRLTQAWTTTTPQCGPGTGSADNQGIDPYAQSYAYDGVGNITSITDGGQTATYTYPQGGANAVRPNAVTSITRQGGTDTYTYDKTGHLTARTVAGKNGTFTWNELGQLEKATIDGQDTTMVYDADGERLIRRDPGGKTTLSLGSMEIEVNGDAITGKRYYTTPDGATIAMRIGGDGVTWLASGLHGSTQLAVNDNTGAVSRERYLPFGQRRGTDDLPFTDLGFLGKTEDDSTGLTYLSARYYDPAIAKFISTDPLLDLRKPQWANPYGYAGNNPIGASDPTGLIPLDYAWGQHGGNKGWEEEKAAAKQHRKAKRYPTYAPSARGREHGYCNAKCKKDVKSRKLDKMIAERKAANAKAKAEAEAKRKREAAAAAKASRDAAIDRFFAEFSGILDSIIYPGASQSEIAALKKSRGWQCGCDLDSAAHAKGLTEGPDTALALVGGVKGPSSRGPSFVVRPNGEAIIVPKGATGPAPVDNGKGFRFTGGNGGHGLSNKTSGVRIMDPTTTPGGHQYPEGYVNYQNRSGQTVDPFTGKTIGKSHPLWHWK